MARNPKINNNFSNADRYHVLNAAQGITSETFDHRIGVANVTPTASGQVRIATIPVLDGDHIDTLAMFMVTAAVGPTLIRFGVWDASGKLIAQTADLSGQNGANTWIIGNLTTPIDVTAPGMLYVGMINVYTTSAPSYVGNTTTAAAFLALPTGFRFSYTLFAQADLPATVALTAGNSGSQNYYMLAY